MTISTQQYTDTIKQQYCEYFGVDKFECEYLYTLEHADIIEKTEILYSCFGLIQRTQTVKFHPMLVRWEINHSKFRVQLDPIIEKYRSGQDVRYRENEPNLWRRCN